MRVLLTGAAGFIASRVAELLLEGGADVCGVDNLCAAYDVRLKRYRLDRLQGRPGFDFHLADVADFATLSAAWEASAPFDAVIHLAARAGVRYSVENPWVYADTNLIGTLNVLELCRRHQVKKLVLASTSSLYGSGSSVPFVEDANTDKPLSPYAASKKAAEALCWTYHHLHGLDVTILRYFTVYGPAGRPDMSPFRFIQWITEQRCVRLYGDGSQSRDFTYVDDIARGTILGLRPLGFEVINLGGDHPHDLLEVIGLIEREVGRTAQIERSPAHAADVDRTWANIEKAKLLLDWEPSVSLKDGIQATCAWYKENREWAMTIDPSD